MVRPARPPKPGVKFLVVYQKANMKLVKDTETGLGTSH